MAVSVKISIPAFKKAMLPSRPRYGLVVNFKQLLLLQSRTSRRLILNPENGFIQNSTVVDIKAGKSVQLTVLSPPRTDTAVILVGEYGREDWPIRELTESWRVWFARSGFSSEDNQGIMRISSPSDTSQSE